MKWYTIAGLGMFSALLGGLAFMLFREGWQIAMCAGGLGLALLAMKALDAEEKKTENAELAKFCKMYEGV